MILVTGAAGYIGSHFVRYYLKQNPDAELVAVDNLTLGNSQSLDSNCSRLHFYNAAIGDSAAVDKIFATHRVDAVVHFAANAYVGESQTKPFKYFENNVNETLRFLQSMQHAAVNKIVFSSTCATFGNPRYVPIDEKHPQKPINTYGSTKLMIEEALRALALSVQVKYVCLRYFNAAGADPSPPEGQEIGESHEPESHLIPLAISAALNKDGKGTRLKVFGNDYETPDGTCVRDYVHVNDLAEAHCLALKLLNSDSFVGDVEESNQLGLALNLGTAHGASVQEVITAVAAVTGSEVPYDLVARRPGDPAALVADFSKAQALLGWQPQFDLKQTVESAYHWELKRRY
ncbi:UDP-glucose 4-epimerase GalE [soil metagenome]